MSDKFWLLGGGLLSFIIFILFEKYVSGYNFQTSLYILSSITQGLAALLAILLTATLIVVQVFRRFTAWKIAMSFETISLIVIYSIGIISPLVFLRIGIESWMLNLSISLMFLCIFVLIPFLIHIGSLFINPVVLGELEQNILEAKNQGAWGKVSSLLQDFGFAWLPVIISGKQLEMEEFYNAWVNIRNHVTRSDRVHYSLIDVVFQTSKNAIQKKNEDYAQKIYISYNIGDDVLQKMYPYYKEQSLKLFNLADKKNQLKICEFIILRLRNNAYRLQHKTPPSNKEKEPKALIEDLLRINRKIAKDTLKKSTGNQPERELFVKLLEEIEVTS